MLIRLSLKLAVLVLATIAAGVLWQQAQLAVLALHRIDPLPYTRTMIAEERYAEAADYLNFFMEYEYVNTNVEAQALTRELASKRSAFQYQANKLVQGIINGGSDESIGQIAGVLTDFFVIGDLRDLMVQGTHLAQGEEVDQLLVALASIGVIATGAQIASGAGTVVSGGAAAPTVIGTTAAKSGLIVVKAAHKLGKLPPWLGKTIIKSAKTGTETNNIRILRNIFGDVSTLAKTPGGLYLLSTTRDAGSLQRMAGFAEAFGANSATLYRLGGDLLVNTAQQIGKTGKNTIQLAATFGQEGLCILDKVGAINFIKYTSRASKMVYKGDIVNLMAGWLFWIPNWILCILVTFGVAVWLPWRRLRWLRQQWGVKLRTE